MKTFSSHHALCRPAAAVTMVLSRTFCLGGGGKSILKKMFEPCGGRKNVFWAF